MHAADATNWTRQTGTYDRKLQRQTQEAACKHARHAKRETMREFVCSRHCIGITTCGEYCPSLTARVEYFCFRLKRLGSWKRSNLNTISFTT